MLNSLRALYQAPYNKQRPIFALYRFAYWKLIRLFKLKNIRYRLWNDRYVYLNHDSFQSMWIMYNYMVDWEEFHLISRMVKPGDQVADIGSNMGFYTVWMSKFIGEKGKIHAFEPDRNNYERLSRNIQLNHIEGMVRANPMALSDRDADLLFTTGLDGENHIAGEKDASVTAVTAKQLDTYATEQNITRLRYVKVDVEGFEYLVLKGARTLLQDKRIDMLQLEINNTLSNSGVSIETLLQLIKAQDYTLCRYDVEANTLVPVEFSKGRDNYFAGYDLALLNQQLASKAS